MWWETGSCSGKVENEFRYLNRRLEFPLESLVSCGNLEIWNVFLFLVPLPCLNRHSFC